VMRLRLVFALLPILAGSQFATAAASTLNIYNWSDYIDPALLDLLYDLQAAVGSHGRYEVISAYRSPQTNQMLRSRSSGVALKSQHMAGKAIDVRLRDVPLKRLRDTAIEMQRGGVGYYPESDFVHLDTARVRRW